MEELWFLSFFGIIFPSSSPKLSTIGLEYHSKKKQAPTFKKNPLFFRVTCKRLILLPCSTKTCKLELELQLCVANPTNLTLPAAGLLIIDIMGETWLSNSCNVRYEDTYRTRLTGRWRYALIHTGGNIRIISHSLSLSLSPLSEEDL